MLQISEVFHIFCFVYIVFNCLTKSLCVTKADRIRSKYLVILVGSECVILVYVTLVKFDDFGLVELTHVNSANCNHPDDDGVSFLND